MKKLVLVLTAMMAVACSQTPEEKATALIQESVKKSLYHPDSYDPVETMVDSAFAPMDDPVFYEKSLKVCHLSVELQKYTEEAKRAQSSMAIWQNSWDAFSKNKYNDAKKENDTYNEKIELLEAKIQKVGEDMMELVESGRKFIGFKVTHKFRAKNNKGNTLMGKNVYITDENFTKILAEYNTDSEDYKLVQELYRQCKEEAEYAKE